MADFDLIQVINLLEQANQHGVKISYDDGDLVVQVQKGKPLDTGFFAQLKAHTQDLKAYFLMHNGAEKARAAVPAVRSYDRPPDGRVPLSFAQERLWFIDKLQGSLQYHISWTFRLRGALDREALQAAFCEIIRRHEVLRTAIREEDGVGYQEVMPAAAWEMQCVAGQTVLAHHAGLPAYVESLVAEPFDLARDIKLRVRLIEVATEEHVLVAVLHHIAADGWSVGILVDELVRLYGARTAGEPLQLAPLPVQYADYARWQREYLSGEVLARKLDYWKERLAGAEPLELPTDHPRPAQPGTGGGEVGLTLGKELRDRLAALSNREGVSLFMTLLAAFDVLLYRYSGQGDICVGSPTAGRGPQEVEGLIGFFINMLALRVRVAGEVPFNRLLQEVKQATLGAYENQEVPFEKIVEALDVRRDLSRTPVFQVMFSLENTPAAKPLRLGAVSLQGEAAGQVRAQFDLTVNVSESGQGIYVGVTYRTDLYERATVERMLAHYGRLLESVVANPSVAVGKLSLLGAAEAGHLLNGFNDTAIAYPAERTVVERFAAQAAQTPEAVAVAGSGRPLTYRELDAQSNQLAHYLRDLGVREETLVPICLERSPDLLVGILGILKAGGAYVPLDPAYPRERLGFVVADTAPRVVVTGRGGDALAEEITGNPPSGAAGAVSVVHLERDRDRIGQCPVAPPATRPDARHLAYVIYTSGSTGRPKGVMVEHRSLVNFCCGMDQSLAIGRDDHLLAITSVAFDISILELLWTVSRGTQVTVRESSTELDNFDRYVPASRGVEMDFSLFFFSSQADGNAPGKYDFLLRAAAFADQHAFSAVWLPERHFHAFGGIFPNPAVLAAALATVTRHVELRSGSVVLPLHDVIRVAEEWSVVDNLSGGRAALSIASGWHADDFVLMPGNYANRQALMHEQIAQLRAYWRGEALRRVNGLGKEIEVSLFPRPVRPELPLWVTSSGSPDTFRSAGRAGAHVLTHLLGQQLDDLERNILAYKQELKRNGHSTADARIAVMLHTYLGETDDAVKAEVKEPFKEYLRSSLGLLRNITRSLGPDDDAIGEKPVEELLELAFENYWQTAALLGTKESCRKLVEKLAAIGVTEVACLVDFGVPAEKVLDSFTHLNGLREMFKKAAAPAEADEKPVSALQITPSYLAALLEDKHSRRFLRQLRQIVVGGEKLPAALVEKLLVRTDATVYNAYGPTETTIWSSVKEIRDAGRITVGKPIANTQLLIVDADGNLCPVGVPGELLIGGDGVARGYLHRAELTAERFIDHPFAPGAGRVYRTGDVARWGADGEVELLGRNDDQVKLRGYRIEPGEIEHCIGQYPGVQRSVVAVKEDAAGGKVLVAYLQVEEGFVPSALAQYLRGRLPEYMVPAAFVVLDALPVTSNGKVDRKALPAPGSGAAEAPEYVAPRNPTEEKLHQVWQQVLGVRQIGVEDNFFELGGHSLLAMRVVAAIGRQMDQEVAIKEIFLYPTIGALAARLREGTRGAGLRGIERYERTGPIPLSFAQERLWFIDKLQGSVHYHMPWVFRLEGRLDKGAFRDAFRAIIGRHEVLRTVVREVEGTGYQFITDGGDWDLGVTTAADLAGRRETLEAYIHRLLVLPFDLSHDSMVRATLIEESEASHVVVVVMHHIVSDAWSIENMVTEMVELYQSRLAHRAPALPELPVQYADYARWQREYLSGEVLARKLGYWQEQLAGVEPLELPTDYPRPARQSTRGEVAARHVGPALLQGLKRLSQQEGATLFMTLLSAYKVLLYRYSGQARFCVGIPIAGRGQQEVEGLIGLFVNTLAMPVQLDGDVPFREVLGQVRRTTLDAYENQEVPFEKVVEALDLPRDASRTPVFQVTFALQNVPPSDGLRLGDVRITDFGKGIETSRYDLGLEVKESPRGLMLSLFYCSDLYGPDTVHRMLAHYEHLLEAIVSDPTAAIDQLSMLGPAEEKQLREDRNETASAYPRDKSIVTLFEEQARLRPGAVALVFDSGDAAGRQLTYGQLDAQSNQLARHLQRKGVGPGTLVPLCLERSPEMIVAILAILKAGGAYVPLDPAYPKDRLHYMLRDTAARLVVTGSEEAALLAGYPGEVVRLDAPGGWTDCPAEPLGLEVSPSQLAYVMYTSGSTGQPKGSLVEHGNVVSLVRGVSYLALDAGQVMLSSGSPSFDASTLEYWGMLLNGGKLVLPSRQVLLQPLVLGRLLQSHRVKTLWCTAGWFNELVEQAPQVFQGLETVVAGGDRLSAGHVRQLQEAYPGLVLVNGYGPTENTTFSTTYRITPLREDATTVPIGRPLENRKAYVVDARGRLCGMGVPGELWVGGAGVSRGYLNQEALTREKFIANPFGEGRLYKTGDLARWGADGNLEYLGRKDEQVKIRGYRIELGEIESVLAHAPGIAHAVVLAGDDPSGNKRLVGYVVTRDPFDSREVLYFLQEQLPEYMVPALLIEVEAIPLTANGKVDKKQLRQMDAGQSSATAYVAPRNEIETTLAAIWQDTLGVDRVGIRDSFFELGGHSLLAIRLIMGIRRELDVEVPLATLFQLPTLADLGEVVEALLKNAANEAEAFEEIPL